MIEAGGVDEGVDEGVWAEDGEDRGWFYAGG